MTNSTKDFDAISQAIADGDDSALNRLMAAEVEEDNDTPEDEVEDTTPLIPEDDSDADNESDGSPKVDNDDEEDSTTEAASSAASTDVPKSEREAELERELNRLRSDAGRVPFIQRRMSELEREVRAYKARESQTTPSKDSKAAEVELDEETKREIEELREVDPVMAKTLERIAKAALGASKNSADHVVSTFTQAEQEREEYNFLMEQKAELARTVPQHEQIFALPEWKAWKDTLTPGQRALAESSYASEAAQAIYAFAAVMKAQQGGATTAAVVAPVVTDNSNLKEARDRKVGGSAEVKSSAAKKSAVLDENAYFNEMYSKIGKENHILK